MHKWFITSIVIGMCFAVIETDTISGQGTNKFEVEIPFPFVLQDRELLAGKYRLERIDPSKPNLLMIKNADAHLVRMILTQRVEKENPSTSTYLMFKRREGKLYLFQVWTTGAINGAQIPSLAEKDRRDRQTDSSSVVKLNATT